MAIKIQTKLQLAILKRFIIRLKKEYLNFVFREVWRMVLFSQFNYPVGLFLLL